MKRTLSLLILATLFLAMISTVSAVNLDFRLDVNKKTYYPNEKVHLNVSIVNRDQFSAKDSQLIVHIADRFYSFDLGDINSGETFSKEIVLGEFSPGTQNIQGDLNYTGFLDDRFVETSYGSFEVLFPAIQRYPRNVYVADYSLPDKVFAGKDYDVSATIKNDGDVKADLVVEFGYVDEFVSENAVLNPGETKTIQKTVKFSNPGVSLLETRVYALIGGEKYLLNYRGKGTYIQDERLSKLSFDKIELVDESDNQINQDDTVKLKLYIKNDGETATDVQGYLSSNNPEINISDSIVNYGVISKGESSASASSFFQIITAGALAQQYNLNLKLNYTDSDNRIKEIQIPITINEGGDTCKIDSDCSDIQICKDSKCQDITCNDGYVQGHKCIKYECVSDSQCSNYQSCNLQTHTCGECSTKTCCSPGKFWFESKQSCVSPLEAIGLPLDSPCQSGWSNKQGGIVWINEKNFACDIFEVKDNSLFSITQESAKCLSSKCGDSSCHSLCKKALKESGADTRLDTTSFKKFMGLYMIYGLGPASKFMKNYFSAEISCGGGQGTCSPVSGYNSNVQQLQCKQAVGKPNGWASDSDMSKNSCMFSDLPAHVNINILHTGTCVDYSISLTTLLRQAGYSKSEVYSVSAPCHEFNLVKFPGDTKWTIVDTVGNSISFGKGWSWQCGGTVNHCDFEADACSNDDGQVTCPAKSEVFEC